VSQENVELVRTIHELWGRGARSDHLIAPDMEYINPPYAVEPGTVKGRGTLNRVRDVYPDFRIETERFVDAGDDVVVIGVARGRGASGVEVEIRQGYVWTIKDGRAIRFRWFNDPAEALAAAGVEGQSPGSQPS
jgi:ketosteroid isomerase-like protein